MNELLTIWLAALTILQILQAWRSAERWKEVAPRLAELNLSERLVGIAELIQRTQANRSEQVNQAVKRLLDTLREDPLLSDRHFLAIRALERTLEQ